MTLTWNLGTCFAVSCGGTTSEEGFHFEGGQKRTILSGASMKTSPHVVKWHDYLTTGAEEIHYSLRTFTYVCRWLWLLDRKT